MGETNVDLNYLHNVISIKIVVLREQKALPLLGPKPLRSDLSLEG